MKKRRGTVSTATQKRELGEVAIIPGRTPKYSRQRTLGLKMTDDKFDQLERLKKMTGWTATDIVEVAFDAFEEAWNAGRIQ